MMNNKVKLVIVSGLFTALTAIGAFIKIPFYPVPFTLQLFFTALAGLVLPARWAVLSQLVYILIGLIGMPVFANGGGFGYILQPTFGYLCFLPLSAFVISKCISHAPDESFIRGVIIVFAGMFITLFGGALWLYLHFMVIIQKEVSFFQTIYWGMVLFLPSTFIKAFLIIFLWRELRKRYRGFQELSSIN
jgi:biotin transport system substrate-specific component